MTSSPVVRMGRVRLSLHHAAVVACGYAVAAIALTVLQISIEARVSDRTGLRRAVYPNIDFSGAPLVEGIGHDITLDFLADNPELPARFFSVRWRGFWYVPEAGELELHGAGDDRLDVWLDGELVIRRVPPSDMHTQTRVLKLDAGVHRLRVEYQQHGGGRALHVAWAPLDGDPRPLPRRGLYPTTPTPNDLRRSQRAGQMERLVLVAWGAPALLALLFLAQRARRRSRGTALSRNEGNRPQHDVAATALAPEPLTLRGVLAVNGVFLALTALFCSRVFLLTDLDSHAILEGDPAANNWQLQWVSRALYTDPLNLFNGNTFHPHPNVVGCGSFASAVERGFMGSCDRPATYCYVSG